MKRYLTIIVLGCSCLLFACKDKDNEGGMSDKAKKNLETSNAIVKMFESGDMSKIGDYIAADAVDHAGMKGDIVGLDSIKAAFAMYQTLMSDMKNETVRELADDEYVFQWLKESWVNKTDGMGGKVGEKQSMDAIEVSKFKDGKVTEHWAFISYTDMMKMMNQAGDNNNMTNQPDTTHK